MNDTSSNLAPIESVRVLLQGAIDYAGLFPPSQLSMSEAVINYATYRNSDYNWLLGRFVVPGARLDEFLENAREFISRDDKSLWRLSVLAGENIYETVKQVVQFNEKNAGSVVIDSLEVKASTISKIENTVDVLPGGLTAYFEIALNHNFAELVSALALANQRAKLRAGGVTPEDFPKSRQIIRFVRTCLGANVLFKATAGLHHPIRCYRPLTYESGGPSGTMHGFLNLFLMTTFARESYRPSLLEELMEDEWGEVFKFNENGVAWRGEHALYNWQIERMRNTGLQSFGSCSFDEPVADLQKLGLL